VAKNCSDKSRACGNSCVRKSYKCRYDTPPIAVKGLDTLAGEAKKTKKKSKGAKPKDIEPKTKVEKKQKTAQVQPSQEAPPVKTPAVSAKRVVKTTPPAIEKPEQKQKINEKAVAAKEKEVAKAKKALESAETNAGFGALRASPAQAKKLQAALEDKKTNLAKLEKELEELKPQDLPPHKNYKALTSEEFEGMLELDDDQLVSYLADRFEMAGLVKLKDKLNDSSTSGERLMFEALKSPAFNSYLDKPREVENPAEVEANTQRWGYRGIKESGSIVADGFVDDTKESVFYGGGMYGDGYYIATNTKGQDHTEALRVARVYAGEGSENFTSKVLAVGVAKDASMLTSEQYGKLKERLILANRKSEDDGFDGFFDDDDDSSSKNKNAVFLEKLNENMSLAALALGYDAVETNETDKTGESHLILLNRSKGVTTRSKASDDTSLEHNVSGERFKNKYGIGFGEDNQTTNQERKANRFMQEGLEADEAEALGLYFGSESGLNPNDAGEVAFKTINRANYGDRSNAKANEIADKISSGLDKLEKADWGQIQAKYKKAVPDIGNPPKLTRVMTLDNPESFISGMVEGKTWVSSSLMSSTVGDEQAFESGALDGNWSKGNIIIKINPKVETSGVAVDKYKNAANEGEILFNRGTGFKVKKITETPDGYELEFDEE